MASISGDAIPFFAQGHIAEDVAVPLFALTHDSESVTFPFFVKGVEPPAAETTLPLFGHGSNGSGQTAFVPLYSYTDASGKTPHIELPLFAQAALVDDVDVSFPMYAAGRTYRREESVTLFALGPSGETAYVPMYASGEGINAGWYPASLAVPLSLRRPFSVFIPMSARGPGTPLDTEITMVTLGRESTSESVEMAVPEAVGHEQQTVRFYTHGY